MTALAAHDEGTDELDVVGFHEFLPTTEEIVAARRFVHSTLTEVGSAPELVAAAELVVEEFALNAVRHAGSFFAVLVECDAGGSAARVAVRDDSNVFPHMPDHVRSSISGWGLTLVASTADEWGTESLGRGKEVWARLHDER